jgi:hypothetical protein
MSENCNESCSSCGENCADRKEPKDLIEKPHQMSPNQKSLSEW